ICTLPALWRKQFPHSEQEYGFSPVCMRRWVLSAPDSRNRRPQTPHGYGFSPVWMRMYCLSSIDKNKTCTSLPCLNTVINLCKSSTLTWSARIGAHMRCIGCEGVQSVVGHRAIWLD
uniref:Uncharacterized protein n=1 Tax=Astatotilapia calliptera TaxID=8154 RepID=A0A3P8Q4D8_ASTCA